MFKLIIEDDEGKTTVVPLIRDEITIGRKEGNTIRLTERNVSRRHAKLIRSNGAIFIEDLESYNGIKVNGARITGKVPVREGDRIEIGDYHLALKLEKAGETPAPSGPTGGLSDQETQQLRLEDQATVRMVPAMPPPTNGPPPVPTDAKATTGQTRPIPAADGAAIAPQAPAMPARLVVVSQQLGGLEFRLDKAAMVIGRTDENDIVLNHRSISRHHAKLLFEGGRYQIVDLKSSNGVRVNGEEYGRVELCRGDIIELGHVRLRFVEAGEEYRFDPATAIDTTAPRSRAGLAAVLVVVMLIGVAASIAWRKGLLGGNGNAGVIPGKADASVPVVATTLDSGPSVVPAHPDAGRAVSPAVETESILTEANTAAKGRDWSKALSLYDRVLEKDPGNASVKKLRQLAEEEQQNATTFDKLTKTAASKDWDQALTLVDALSPQSVYRTDAKELLERVRTGYLARHKDLAQKALRDKKYEVARQEANLMLKVAPDDGDAKALLARAETLEQKAEQRRNQQAAAPVVKRQPEKAPKAQVAEERPSPEKLKDLARQAGEAQANGRFGEAMKLAAEINKWKPSVGYRIIALVQCKQRSGAARQAYGRFVRAGATEYEKNLIRSVCEANGITLPQ